MKGIVKSTACSRSYVMVRSAMAISAFCNRETQSCYRITQLNVQAKSKCYWCAAPYLRRLVTGFPPRRPGFKPRSGPVGFCDGQKWRWGRFSPRSLVSPANLHYVCFSTIIFTITRGWHNRPGVAAVAIASQTRIKKKSASGDGGIQYVGCCPSCGVF
jgi:hypothetical protein